MSRIIPSKITIPQTLYDLLNGTNGDLYLQNDYITPIGCNIMKSNRKLFDYKEIKGKQPGMTFQSPMLYVKVDGKFTNTYRVELTSKLKSKESYRIKRPNEACYPNGLGKLKNYISIKIIERDLEMKKMVEIDNVVYMGAEFLMLASMCSYDFSKAKNDKELIEGLFKTISPNHFNILIDLLDEGYYELFTTPPEWHRDETIAGNWFIPDKDGKYLSLFNVIYGIRSNKDKEFTKEVVNNLFNGKTKGNPYYEFIMKASSNDILPMCKYMYVEFEDESKVFNEMKLMFYIKHENDSNSKIGDGMYTKEYVNKNGNYVLELLNGNKFMKMISMDSSETNPSAYKVYSGFIWVANSLDLVKYGVHQCHSNWKVKEVILTESQGSFGSLSIDDGYFEDMGEDTVVIEDIRTTIDKKVKSAEELAEALEEE